MAVGILDVVIDFLDQFLDAAKRSPAKSSLRNAVEPDLHLIEPGGIGWSEVYVEPWPCSEPASNSQMFVRGVIIHDDVHLQVLGYVLFNLPEKTQIFLMPVVLSTFREHFAVCRVQCGKQRGSSVTPTNLFAIRPWKAYSPCWTARSERWRRSEFRRSVQIPVELRTAIENG